MNNKKIADRLEYLRGEIRAERISYGEVAELQGLAKYIDKGDVELLGWAGVPENLSENRAVRCNHCNWNGREQDLWQEEEETVEHCPNCNKSDAIMDLDWTCGVCGEVFPVVEDSICPKCGDVVD